jgi:Na+-translocating ferredoxin:NAD+ oxidoreductase subunit B
MPNDSSNSPLEQLCADLDDCLPQTQCGQCGYNGCYPYAQAMATGEAPINRCAPGGAAGIALLAEVLNQDIIALDPNYGTHQPRRIANILKEHCIGCTLCIKACPVDAIVGANKRRHAILADLCTGCELCLPPCPVDCIELLELPKYQAWSIDQAHEARSRMQKQKTRKQRIEQQKARELEEKTLHKLTNLEEQTRSKDQLEHKQAMLAAALEKARARRKLKVTI